ncbi:hypothetical protein VNI00_011102 [Paramarasmius palmivorus]|uniref:Uncharacterized protein n=1 Tax=Paramarasmius palmivorus TaxID=297713 RepID=A0AAW0CED7_9AGAR
MENDTPNPRIDSLGQWKSKIKRQLMAAFEPPPDQQEPFESDVRQLIRRTIPLDLRRDHLNDWLKTVQEKCVSTEQERYDRCQRSLIYEFTETGKAIIRVIAKIHRTLRIPPSVTLKSFEGSPISSCLVEYLDVLNGHQEDHSIDGDGFGGGCGTMPCQRNLNIQRREEFVKIREQGVKRIMKKASTVQAAYFEAWSRVCLKEKEQHEQLAIEAQLGRREVELQQARLEGLQREFEEGKEQLKERETWLQEGEKKQHDRNVHLDFRDKSLQGREAEVRIAHREQSVSEHEKASKEEAEKLRGERHQLESLGADLQQERQRVNEIWHRFALESEMATDQSYSDGFSQPNTYCESISDKYRDDNITLESTGLSSDLEMSTPFVSFSYFPPLANADYGHNSLHPTSTQHTSRRET